MLNKFAIKFLHIGGGGEKVLRQWVAQLGPQNFTRILNLYKGAVQDYVKVRDNYKIQSRHKINLKKFILEIYKKYF